ncbi:hypothetical protein [Dapis sp. BLCC M172]|uniref:hypothetical protein n=1 Tax=Dapis sp. BLCC M172 TaxID=2975281 RepID=UPI003CEDDEE3
MIPPKKNRKELRNYDEILQLAPHLIENFFAKLKQYRALAEPSGSYIATRYDKRSVNFLGGIPRGSFSHFIDIAIAISMQHKIPILSTSLIDDTS